MGQQLRRNRWQRSKQGRNWRPQLAALIVLMLSSSMSVAVNTGKAAGWDGTGVGVAVIDSGISDHPDLHDPATGLSRVVYNESFVPATDSTDGYGHGTHVAGIIAGNGSQSKGAIYGVAPHVNLINLKVLDSNGSGQ